MYFSYIHVIQDLSILLSEKERTDREREASLAAAQGRIASLENKIGSLETSRKRARIEVESEMDHFKTERMVRRLFSVLILFH